MEYTEIKENLESNGNILTVTMLELRDASKNGKLGVHVRDEISKTLAGMGLGHVPTELPLYQHEPVRLYKRGTAIGEVIELVLAPGESNDKKLKDQFSDESVSYADIIEKIRELVNE